MSAKIIDGNALADALKTSLKEKLQAYSAKPDLAVILVGNNPASLSYIKNKVAACKSIGINSEIIHLPETITQNDLFGEITRLNSYKELDGILVQMPLPDHIDTAAVLNLIDPEKDVDGFHPINVGKLATGATDGHIPCTPKGIIKILESVHGKNLAGKNVVVLGRSNIVGKPVAQLLLQKDCTVTVCHSKTTDIPEKVRQADIVVVAIGKPKFVQAEWIKPGATVIDVGINQIGEKNGKAILCGDVDYKEAVKVAGYITPVPGGVGPMTIACLLENTSNAFFLSMQKLHSKRPLKAPEKKKGPTSMM